MYLLIYVLRQNHNLKMRSVVCQEGEQSKVILVKVKENNLTKLRRLPHF